MILNKSIIFKLIICFFISIIFPVEYTNYEFEIFSLPIDARTNSLGGIATSESMSLNRVYSLNKSHKKGKTLFSYGSSYSNIINYFQISRVILESKNSRFGISFLHKQISDIPYTQDAWEDYGNPISLPDIDYNSISSYYDQQISMIFLYSHSSEIGDIGIKIKPFYTSIHEYYSLGFSMDLGINQRFTDNLIIGYSIKDLLSINKWSTGESNSLYPRFCFLASYSKKKYLLISEISSDLLSNYKYKVGYENSIYKKIKAQIGYSSIKSISLGFSFKHQERVFSYSFTPNLNNIILGHDHLFSILLDLPNN